MTDLLITHLISVVACSAVRSWSIACELLPGSEAACVLVADQVHSFRASVVPSNLRRMRKASVAPSTQPCCWLQQLLHDVLPDCMLVLVRWSDMTH